MIGEENQATRTCYPQSHPKHVEALDEGMGEPACTPKGRVAKELLSPDEVAERWNLTYNLGSAVSAIFSVATENEDHPLARFVLLEHAKYRIEREIDRERRLRE